MFHKMYINWQKGKILSFATNGEKGPHSLINDTNTVHSNNEKISMELGIWKLC